MNRPTTFTGPIERAADKLLLRVPLKAGGSQLAHCCRGISAIRDDALYIEIGEWIAAQLDLSEGSLVEVNDSDGKFNIRACADK